MARLFPLRSETPTTRGRPRIVGLDGEDADAVFSALSSSTAREIYVRLGDEPGTASDVAEAIDSSIQNVRYHLDKLEDAGLVEVVDTWYSSRGNEMSVYAVTDGPLIVTDDRSRADQLREAISRFLGGVAVLLGASMLVQYAASSAFAPGVDDAVETDDSDPDPFTVEDDGEPTAPPEEEEVAEEPPMEDDVPDAEEITPDEPDGLLDAVTDTFLQTLDGFATVLSPGLAFFLGGLVVLSLVTGWWYLQYRPYEG